MSLIEVLYGSAVLLSGLWFAAAFRFFSLQNMNAAKVLVPRAHRNSPLFESIAALTPFIGGFNGALSLLCLAMGVLVAGGSDLFAENTERCILLCVIAVAHLTQFWFNVPVLRSHKVDGNTLWPVTTGPMRRIFVGDITLAAFTFAAAGAVAFS